MTKILTLAYTRSKPWSKHWSADFERTWSHNKKNTL